MMNCRLPSLSRQCGTGLATPSLINTASAWEPLLCRAFEVSYSRVQDGKVYVRLYKFQNAVRFNNGVSGLVEFFTNVRHCCFHAFNRDTHQEGLLCSCDQKARGVRVSVPALFFDNL